MFTVYKKKKLCEDNGKDQTTYKKKPSKKCPCSCIPICLNVLSLQKSPFCIFNEPPSNKKAST